MRVLGGHWEHKAGLGRRLRRAQGSINATGASQALCQSQQCISRVTSATADPDAQSVHRAGSAHPILYPASLVPLPEVVSLGTMTSVFLGFVGHWVFLVSPLCPVPCCPRGFPIVPSVPTAIWGHRGCGRATAQ